MRRALVFALLAVALSARAEPNIENIALHERTIAQVDTSSITQRQRQGLIEEGHRLYLSGNYKEALKLAEEALQSNPSDKNALSLKYSLIGRIGTSKQSGPAQSVNNLAASPEASVTMQEPKKIKVAGEPPPMPYAPVPNQRSPLSPLVPLGAGAIAAAAAYSVKRSNTTAIGEDKIGKEIPPASKTEKIIGYVLTGAAIVAIVVVAGVTLLRFAPAAGGLVARLGGQTTRAIGPSAATIVAEEEAIAPRIVEGARQIVINKGELFTRLWHSNWEEGSGLSGPLGRSLCRGECFPSNAKIGIIERGLNIPGVKNNAQMGSVLRAKETIIANVQKSINGISEEIVIRSEDVNKFEEIRRIRIPPGGQ